MSRKFVAWTLRRMRNSLGMTQVEFSNAIGITQSWLSRVEAGLGPVDAEIYLRAYRLWKHHLSEKCSSSTKQERV